MLERNKASVAEFRFRKSTESDVSNQELKSKNKTYAKNYRLKKKMKVNNPEKSNLAKIGTTFKILERDKLQLQMQLHDV